MKNLKVFLILLILIFNFQSFLKADDIKDFQIEGMSIGDSLLDYFSEEEIKKARKDYRYNNEDFITVEFYDLPSFNIYQNLSVSFKFLDINSDE